ncbi:hypothetical protein [Desulfogranum marinum]|jgi:hypothetical protein|uniref:hypothetical protein n=1 Tax=Desulfogranum marinum TaxID=453220 RepID=UPI0019625D8B|nr:hypothetical protein [Desulfogranum marinum]MBM9513825.1 hypothetical protein [Desulfogranum marinum]
MTFIEFKKLLLDAEITLPKFCKLIKVSDKNIQSYKKKGYVPNTIAVIVTCFAKMQADQVDYRALIDSLELKKQTKKGGFKKKNPEVENTSTESKISGSDPASSVAEKKNNA